MPRRKPWKVGERIGPRNLATEQPYRGGNTIRLMAEAEDRGYSDSRWGTYGQIQEAGGQVRKGERGTQILSFKTHRQVPVKDEKGRPVTDDKGKQVYRHQKLARPFTRIYTVFNAEQARGIKPEPRPTPTQAWEAHKRAEAVIQASGVPVEHKHGDRAYYELQSDKVVLPEKNQFASADNYYQTALHELGHATGHPDRMDRDTLKDGMDQGFGSEPYAREELRAEISAMMTGDRLGTGHDPSRSAAYVKSWVEVLDKNPREIVAASAEAQRMSDYLIGRARERTQEPVEMAARRGQGEAPEYRPVEVPHRPGVYRIQNAKDPGQEIPRPYGTMYAGKAKAEQAIERLREDQKRGYRAAEPVRRATNVIVKEPSSLSPGGAARVTPLRDRGEGFIRGAGRPGVRKDPPPQPDRGGPER